MEIVQNCCEKIDHEFHELIRGIRGQFFFWMKVMDSSLILKHNG